MAFTSPNTANIASNFYSAASIICGVAKATPRTANGSQLALRWHSRPSAMFVARAGFRAIR